MKQGRVQQILYSVRGRSDWLRVARNLGAFYRGRPAPAPPMAVAWDLSYRCDCRCPFCNTHELNRTIRALPRASALVIARKLADAGVPHVTLAGGEPLLVSYWSDVAKLLSAAGCHVAVATNGSQLADAADDVVACGVRSITISIDDVDGDRHDDARRRPGLSAAIAKGLERLRAVDPERRIAVRVRMVLTPSNYGQMTELVEAWRGAVDEVSFQPVEDSGRDHIHHPGEAFAGFTAADEEPFRRALARLFARFPEFDAPYYRRMPQFLFRHAATRNDFHCLIPAVTMKVRADGHAITCSGGAKTLGDLVTQPLAEIWNAEPICTLRRDSRNRQRSCYCWVQPTQINYRAPEPARRLLLRVVGTGDPP